jgi:hypothetical protein
MGLLQGETNTDDLSPAPDAWSRPDIPLHGLAMLKLARCVLVNERVFIVGGSDASHEHAFRLRGLMLRIDEPHWRFRVKGGCETSVASIAPRMHIQRLGFLVLK